MDLGTDSQHDSRAPPAAAAALPGPGLNCPSYLQLKVSKLMVKYFQTLSVVHGRSSAQSVLYVVCKYFLD